MAEQMAETFIAALHALEEHGDLEPLAALYTGDAVIGNILTPDGFLGPDGARRFWTEYRGSFETLESSFRSIIAGAEKAALEWTTRGTTFDGAAINYSGVTVLEFTNGKVSRSTAYFDPKALGRHMEAKMA